MATTTVLLSPLSPPSPSSVVPPREQEATRASEVVSAVAVASARNECMCRLPFVLGGNRGCGRVSTSFVGASRIRFEGLRAIPHSQRPLALPCRSRTEPTRGGWVRSERAQELAQSTAPDPHARDPGRPPPQRGRGPGTGAARGAGPAGEGGPVPSAKGGPRPRRAADRRGRAATLRGAAARDRAGADRGLRARWRVRERADPLPLDVRRPARPTARRPRRDAGLPAHPEAHVAGLPAAAGRAPRAARGGVAAGRRADGRLVRRRARGRGRPARRPALRPAAHPPRGVRPVGGPDR